MTLETFSDLPIESPLLVDLGGKQDSLTLSEMAGFWLLHIRGAEVEMALPPFDIKIGDVAPIKRGMLVRLRRDEFTVLSAYEREALNQFEERMAGRHITVTDITHGRCMLLLIGQEARSVLRKVCALDFSDAVFPDMHAAQTSLAKVRTLIIRTDFGGRQGYMLIVDRSLGQYVWNVVIDAMQEFA